MRPERTIPLIPKAPTLEEDGFGTLRDEQDRDRDKRIALARAHGMDRIERFVLLLFEIYGDDPLQRDMAAVFCGDFRRRCEQTPTVPWTVPKWAWPIILEGRRHEISAESYF